MTPSSRSTTQVLLALAAAGCASGTLTPPGVPDALRAPLNQTLFLETLATGVQIYECVAKPDAPSGYAWNFVAPEATLADRSGKTLGKHFAGPTWQSNDGSSVVGEVTARDPGPDKTAIPWLLLTAKSSAGAGVFTQTKTIQRVKTTAGLAPSDGCNAGTAKQVARVPYTAVYYFYRPNP